MIGCWVLSLLGFLVYWFVGIKQIVVLVVWVCVLTDYRNSGSSLFDGQDDNM